MSRRTGGWLGRLKVLIIGLALAAGASTFAGGPAIVFDIRVPQGVHPTIVTDTDNSGSYKLERIAANAYRLVNADRKVAVRVIQEPGRYQNELGVENCGSNGPDPVPSGLLTVIFSSGGVIQSTAQTLQPGQTTSCSACDAVQARIGPN